MNGEGKQKQSSRGLNLQMADMFGSKLSEEDMQREMQDKKIKAVIAWNRMDQSDQPRLQVPERPWLS